MVAAIFLIGALLATVLVIWSIVKPASMPWYGSVIVLCLLLFCVCWNLSEQYWRWLIRLNQTWAPFKGAQTKTRRVV